MTRLELNADEVKALLELMDAGVKAVGLRGVTNAAYLLAKIEVASKECEELQKRIEEEKEPEMADS